MNDARFDLASVVLSRHERDQHGYCSGCLARWPCLQAQLALQSESLVAEVAQLRGDLNDAYDVILFALVDADPTPEGTLREDQLAMFDRVRDRVHAYEAALAAESREPEGESGHD